MVGSSGSATAVPVLLNKENSSWIRIAFRDPSEQVVGSVKEVVGKVLGDQKTEADGKAEKAAGKIQNAVGSIKDTVRETVKK